MSKTNKGLSVTLTVCLLLATGFYLSMEDYQKQRVAEQIQQFLG